ncbi:hypothetical protein Agabi119p4_11612 [Agaricus bisporus var. burnettii]|uniref:Uncharacterized protein n=1 Tax=Agaricus bisporus var. burnettii TaxID=192524 RepID=A0A8H7BZG6_AGABI|nr:hypothetical protein Agabi119p4_11612 [Agaricus bisporus var. burnettii]
MAVEALNPRRVGGNQRACIKVIIPHHSTSYANALSFDVELAASGEESAFKSRAKWFVTAGQKKKTRLRPRSGFIPVQEFGSNNATCETECVWHQRCQMLPRP